ncbi:MAG: LytR C-terminal domain-containing protein [Patescibacteria group bacterium]|nr:LytR C-terminal domain-containing protein [Patescibacteria group bacterium]
MSRKRILDDVAMESDDQVLGGVSSGNGELKKGRPYSNLFSLGLITVMLVCAMALGFKQMISPRIQTPTENNPISAPVDVSQPETQDLVALVARHVSVDAATIPTINKLDDIDSLREKDPAFYQSAQKGDLLFIWADKIVLYSVSKDLVLSVLPISAPSGDVTNVSSDGQAVEKTTIEVRNGAGKAGIAKTVAEKLANLGFSALSPANAARNDYPLTLVIKLTEQNVTQAQSLLLNQLDVSDVTSTFPTGEKESSADFVVILGQDAINE